MAWYNTMGDEQQLNPTKNKRVVKSTIIDHSYHDYAYVPIQNVGFFSSAVSTARAQNFPAKLHEIVSTPGYQHIIAWLPHGRSWHIRNKELLVSVVLKDHFSHSHFESFNRQVNLWGFKRLYRGGPDYKSYYHEAFLRGRPDLTHLVRRLKNEGKRIPHITTEPNFYQMPVLPTLGLPISDVITPAVTGGLGAGHAGASASSGSKMGGHAAVDQRYERTAFSSHSQSYNDATCQTQQLHQPFHDSTPSTLTSFPMSSGISNVSNHASHKHTSACGDGYHFSDRHESHESFQLTEAANVNDRISHNSQMESGLEFSSAPVGRTECRPQGHSVSADILHPHGVKFSHDNNVNELLVAQIHPKTCKGLDVSSAVTMFGSSYSSGNMTPYASTYSSSSGQNDSDFTIRVVPTAITAHTHHTSDSTTSDPNEANTHASTALRSVTMGPQSVALLSSPPNDPVLEEFAREYLPHFGEKNDNHR